MCNFFERLLEERKRLGLNQEAMAALGGVAKRTYCNYESGDREPGVSFMQSIAAAGVDVQYVLTGNKAETSPGAAAFAAAVNAPVNQALLEDCLKGVETHLATHRLTLPVDKKARLVVLLYNHFIGKGKADQATITSYVDLCR